MNTDEMKEATPEKKHSKSDEIAIAEENNHARHVFTSAVGWFTLFMTANYFTAGWLAKSIGDSQKDWKAICFVAALFISQNVIGMRAFKKTREHFFHIPGRMKARHDRIDQAAKYPPTYHDYCPAKLYASMIQHMRDAMRIMLIAWSILFAYILFEEFFTLKSHTTSPASEESISLPPQK